MTVMEKALPAILRQCFWNEVELRLNIPLPFREVAVMLVCQYENFLPTLRKGGMENE